MRRLLASACLLVMAVLGPGAARPEELIDHGRFTDVRVFRPAGEPHQFVLYLSGAKGWTSADAKHARLLAQHGAMVAGVDTPKLQAKLGPNEVPVGDFENLSHYLQGYARLPTYYTPLLAASATRVAYARTLDAKAPPDIFAGVLVEQDARKLAAAYDRAAQTNQPALRPPPASLADLPLVEAPATGAAKTKAAKETFAILLSGDGGWAGIDKKVAASLGAQGVSVVGVDSLRYFWSARTPEGLASDLDRIVRYYSANWKKKRVLLVGYSQGANALPASFNRMPAASRYRVSQVVLMGLERRVAWEFRVTNWLGTPADGQPILPEAVKLNAATTLCIYGAGDANALCPELPKKSVTAKQMPGGHHFNGAYDALATEILARVE